ncbi:pirin family protein [Achromobacter sp.]|uniref:pirin family protein n=1 Tax=Achromobacter sp. TaxID=134375 RepID=UPI0031D159BA
MNKDFVLRAHDRGFEKFLSTGEASSYIAGHPEGMVTRHSSFNFGAYQSGIPGFGRIRVFGEEVFSGTGSGYNMHRHHDFIICAFVLAGTLTHVNTVGNIDQLGPNDFYAFSAGSGGKHSELNLASTDMQVLYLWLLPDRLLTPPSYTRSHFDASTRRNQLTQLVGNADGALRISQDVSVSRLVADQAMHLQYTPKSNRHGVYVFVLDGEASVDDITLARRDSRGVWGDRAITIQTDGEGADLLIIETIQ